MLRGAVERAVVAPVQCPKSPPLPMLDDRVGGGFFLTQRNVSGLEDHGDAASFGAYSDFLPDGRRPWAVRGDSPLLSSHGHRAVHGLASTNAVDKATTARSVVRNDGVPAPLPGSLRRSLTSLTSSYVSEGPFADAAVEYDPWVRDNAEGGQSTQVEEVRTPSSVALGRAGAGSRGHSRTGRRSQCSVAPAPSVPGTPHHV